MVDELNKKQRAFADEYLKNNRNGKQAAIAAGYTERSAETTASRLLRNAKVEKYLAKKTKKVLDKRDSDITFELNGLLDIFHGKTIISHNKQIDHLKNDETVKDMTYEYTPDMKSRLEAINLFLNHATPLMKIQQRKLEAETKIAENKAEKLSKGGQVNDLLESLLDVKEGGDGTGKD